MLAYRLYCEIPFGKMHHRNERVIQLARLLGRTPGSVALRLVNFAHLDPALQARGIRGMSNVSSLDREVANAFATNWDSAVEATAKAWAAMEPSEPADAIVEGPTEGVATAKVRLTQRFFRRAVLAAYDFSCCACQIETRELLVASHIIPWSVNSKERTNPRNGLAFCALHDRAFDAGLLTVSPSYVLRISPELRRFQQLSLIRVGFLDLAGERIRLPSRFVPEQRFLRYHNRVVFKP